MPKYYECWHTLNVVAVHKLDVLLLGGVDIYERCYVASRDKSLSVGIPVLLERLNECRAKEIIVDELSWRLEY